MRTLFCGALYCLCLAVNPALGAEGGDPGTLHISHVTVVDVATGTELKDQTVVVQAGRIVSVAASAASPSAPEGQTQTAQIIDAHGAFLIPGLWDMHVHVQEMADLPLYIAN